MKIIYFEDDPSALFKVDYIKEVLAHDVWHTQNFLELLYWLECDPGAKHFHALMFDLTVPVGNLPDFDQNEPYKHEKHHSPSIYFIEKYISKEWSDFFESKKIIICSAFFQAHRKNGVDFNRYYMLDKKSPTMIDDLKRILDEIGE